MTGGGGGGGGGAGAGLEPTEDIEEVDEMNPEEDAEDGAPLTSFDLSVSSSLIFSSSIDCLRFESSSFDERVFRSVE